MFSRRGILGLFGGLFSWFAAKKVVAEPVVELQTLDHVLPEGFVPLPEWCPKGFIPMMGQIISKHQFPNLFYPITVPRKDGSRFRYLPPFFEFEDRGIARLFYRYPTIPTELQAHGWVDKLTQIPRKEADTRIMVHLMAARPQTASNGRVSQAGFSTFVLVEREEFERFYGPIEESGKSKMFFDGYEDVEPYS